MSAERRTGVESPCDRDYAGRETADNCGNHRAAICPRQLQVGTLDFGLWTPDFQVDASGQIPSTPAGNFAACKPTRRGPWPDARGISGATCPAAAAWVLKRQSRGTNTTIPCNLQQNAKSG